MSVTISYRSDIRGGVVQFSCASNSSPDYKKILSNLAKHHIPISVEGEQTQPSASVFVSFDQFHNLEHLKKTALEGIKENPNVLGDNAGVKLEFEYNMQPYPEKKQENIQGPALFGSAKREQGEVSSEKLLKEHYEKSPKPKL